MRLSADSSVVAEAKVSVVLVVVNAGAKLSAGAK